MRRADAGGRLLRRAVLHDVDWETLVFLAAIFVLVQAFTKTGLLQGLSVQLYNSFGSDLTLVALIMLAGIGMLSAVLANIPVVAAALVMGETVIPGVVGVLLLGDVAKPGLGWLVGVAFATAVAGAVAIAIFGAAEQEPAV